MAHDGYKDKEKRKKWLKDYYSRADKKAERAAYDAKRRAAPGYREKTWEQFILKEYGITGEEYHSLFKAQDGRCAICGIHQDDLRKKLSVDHNHTTGKVRGLLCDKCNQGLGYFNDSPERLKTAIEYVKS